MGIFVRYNSKVPHRQLRRALKTLSCRARKLQVAESPRRLQAPRAVLDPVGGENSVETANMTLDNPPLARITQNLFPTSSADYPCSFYDFQYLRCITSTKCASWLAENWLSTFFQRRKNRLTNRSFDRTNASHPRFNKTMIANLESITTLCRQLNQVCN